MIVFLGCLSMLFKIVSHFHQDQKKRVTQIDVVMQSNQNNLLQNLQILRKKHNLKFLGKVSMIDKFYLKIKELQFNDFNEIIFYLFFYKFINHN